jgi:1,4-alpha-glucan branching enzyme
MHFTPVIRLEYQVACLKGQLTEILIVITNYGGSGETDKIVIEAMPYDGRDYSVALVLPPLGVVVLKLHKSRRLFLLTKQWFSSNETIVVS